MTAIHTPSLLFVFTAAADLSSGDYTIAATGFEISVAAAYVSDSFALNSSASHSWLICVISAKELPAET